MHILTLPNNHQPVKRANCADYPGMSVPLDGGANQ